MGRGWRGFAHALLSAMLVWAALAQPVTARGEQAADPNVAGAAAAVSLVQLPAEARHTIALVRSGGPFPYERDGAVFRNFERRLPPRDRTYYRGYTVRTPGLKHRGARRIVAGRGGELYYTEDHYNSFQRVAE